MDCLEPHLLMRLERLFDQQMWAFGCDVRRPGDNLLARRGLVRRAAEPGAPGSGVWQGEEDGLTLALSSVGVAAARGGLALHLRRDPMGRQLVGVSPSLLAELFCWFARYEDWVATVAEPGWRGRALASRTRRPFLAAPEVAQAWRALASRCGAAFALSAGRQFQARSSVQP